MDASRLIVVARRALAGAGDAEGIVAEAWQALALVDAVAARLDPSGAGCAGGESGVRGDRPRAARLTGVGEPRRVLRDLLELLGEVVVALVGVARAAEVSLYWRCVEAVDAAGDAADRVRALLADHGPRPPAPEP